MGRKSDNRKLEYDDRAMKLGVRFYRESEIPLDLLYHLMKSKRLQTFSAVMVRSDMEAFGEFLQQEKRKTDLLYPIIPEENIYALFCQETQVDGGYYFIQRLAKLIEERGADDIHAAIVGVESTKYPVKDLMFIILDTFIRATALDTRENIIYRTVK
jgi:hypothetical protein